MPHCHVFPAIDFSNVASMIQRNRIRDRSILQPMKIEANQNVNCVDVCFCCYCAYVLTISLKNDCINESY